MSDAKNLVRAAGQALKAGKAAEGLKLAEQALAADPGDADAQAHRASALQTLGRGDEALAAFDALLALRPGHVAGLVNSGVLLMGRGKHVEALERFDRAAAASPNLAQVHTNRSHALCDLERYDEALAAAERAIALRPTHTRAWTRRGDALFALERYDEAIESFRTALSHGSGEYGWVGLAQCFRAMGRHAEAIEAFDRAEAAAPGSPMTRYLRALVKFTSGDVAGAWSDYEARWAYPGFYSTSNGYVAERLRGRLTLNPTRETLAGRRVLVLAEQGVGDQLMHASMLPDLARDAAGVTWVCDRRLHRLLGASFPTVRFLDSRDAPLPDPGDFDHLLASASLGCAYRDRPDAFPGVAYVRPTEPAMARWAERLGPKTGRLRIGIAWRGGLVRTGRTRRSMTFDDLAPLVTRPDLEFVSLQYGEVEAEVRAAEQALGREIRTFPAAEIDDFDDAAAVVCNLDLVVSVQQTLVHLTGALGQPGYIMVPSRPEWRYLATGSTMPWYGSITLFRQTQSASWPPVVAEVLEAVDRLAAKQP